MLAPWHSRLFFCLHHWRPVWALILVSAALLLIQPPSCGVGKQREGLRETCRRLQALGSWLLVSAALAIVDI